MLEILLLIYLCRELGKILRAKGRSAGWFQFLLVILWFGGEFFGAVAAVIIGFEDGPAIYLGALLGAAGGAVLGFVIAKSVAPALPQGPPGFEVVGSVRRPEPSEL